MLFHPLRQYRKFRRWLKKRFFVRSCKRKDIRLTIGESSFLDHCYVKGTAGGEVFIGENCRIHHCSLNFYGQGGQIIFREGTTVNAGQGTVVLFVGAKPSLILERTV